MGRKAYSRYAFRWLLVLAMLGVGGCDLFKQHDVPVKPVTGKPFDLFVATDIHYLSPKLHDNGQAFQTFISDGDGKLLSYIDQMTDAFAEEISRKKPQALILSGDLTSNGEKASHEDLAAKLGRIEASGTAVYVIPGNHDILNPWARKFKTDSQYKTEFITPDQFKQIYGNFGYNEAISSDKTTLSYLAAASDDLWLLMLDTCQYDKNTLFGVPQTDGEIPGPTLKWIEECSDLAQKKGARILTVMHHNLADHTTVPMEGFTLNNSKEAIRTLKSARLNLVLSGHIHIQDIRDAGDGIYDIATSSFGVYPHHYGVLHYEPKPHRVSYHTAQVDVSQWARDHHSTDEHLLSFDAYARQFFADHSYAKAYPSLKDLDYSEEQKKQMARAMAEINVRYFGGTVDQDRKQLESLPGYQLWLKAKAPFMTDYIKSMLEPKKLDNNFLEVILQGTN